MLAILLLVVLVSPALVGPAVRCTWTYSPTLNRYDSLCSDGTRAVSTWSPTLQRWQTTITNSPRQTCMATMNPHTQKVEVRCP
jgi:hypothetical protein